VRCSETPAANFGGRSSQPPTAATIRYVNHPETPFVGVLDQNIGAGRGLIGSLPNRVVECNLLSPLGFRVCDRRWVLSSQRSQEPSNRGGVPAHILVITVNYPHLLPVCDDPANLTPFCMEMNDFQPNTPLGPRCSRTLIGACACFLPTSPITPRILPPSSSGPGLIRSFPTPFYYIPIPIPPQTSRTKNIFPLVGPSRPAVEGVPPSPGVP
jgi:hypothetical protein